MSDLRDKVWYRGANEYPGWLYLGEGNSTTEQFGPGLYFSDRYETARAYGQVKAFSIRKLEDLSGKPLYFFDNVNAIATHSPNYADPKLCKDLVFEFMEMAADYDFERFDIVLSNWDEKGLAAINKLFRSVYYNSFSMAEVMQSVASEIFRNATTEFLMSCRALNVGGLILHDPFKTGYKSEQYLVLYDPLLVRELNLSLPLEGECDDSYRY
jgi:hypothetical protein